MPLVDANVLLDVFTGDSVWADWSVEQIDRLPLEERYINDIVYAEISVRSPTMGGLDAALIEMGFQLWPTPRSALFLAGKAFAIYRARGGLRPHVLPDFFIGALAAVEGLPLLTRDARRIRTYFPTVRLVSP